MVSRFSIQVLYEGHSFLFFYEGGLHFLELSSMGVSWKASKSFASPSLGINTDRSLVNIELEQIKIKILNLDLPGIFLNNYLASA